MTDSVGALDLDFFWYPGSALRVLVTVHLGRAPFSITREVILFTISIMNHSSSCCSTGTTASSPAATTSTMNSSKVASLQALPRPLAHRDLPRKKVR